MNLEKRLTVEYFGGGEGEWACLPPVFLEVLALESASSVLLIAEVLSLFVFHPIFL